MAFDILLSPPHIGADERALVTEAFDSNWIAPIGPFVRQFELDLQALTGFAHVAALSSGTAALHLAIRLLEIGPGDEVWAPTLTFIGGIAPVLYEGAQLRFFDCERGSTLIDLALLERKLAAAEQAGGLPKAVITTDLYGYPVEAARVRALADRYGFTWISDAAESVGSHRAGHHAGRGADFAVYSFNGNKIITTSGGGALASDNGELNARAVFLATQARDPAPHYEHSTYGYNYRLSNVCAAIGVGQLRQLTDRVAARRRIFRYYRDRLGTIAGTRFIAEPPGVHANHWLTTMFIEPPAQQPPAAVIAALAAAGIESRPLWKPMHLQPLFAQTPCVGGETAAALFATGMCLPSGSALTDAELDRVCAAVEQVLRP